MRQEFFDAISRNLSHPDISPSIFVQFGRLTIVTDTESALILSDPHHASAAERARVNFEIQGIANPFIRFLIIVWRRFFWLRDPFAHNYLLDRFLARAGEPPLVIANGDYSCDSAFVGVADPASRQSARECLDKLRQRFGERLLTTIGDHELGKSSLAGNRGGLRLESWRVATQDLQISPVWERRVGDHVLIGVTSSLIALEVFEPDALPEEIREWQRLRAEHIHQLRAILEKVKASDRIILFCHDPTALPYLANETFVQPKLGQIEKTIIGHLHTPMVFWKARLLAGLPPIRFLGQGVRRISRGLNRARAWKPFNVLLCPSLSGSQLLKDGGYYEMKLSGGAPAQFTRRRLRWEKS